MPLLNFKCDNCKEVFEEIVGMGTVEAACPKCSALCPRAFEGECNLHVPGNPTGRLRKGAGAPDAGTRK
ncbi:MAG: zinc ribbon domain-containing protein [Bacillota bacterium]